LAPANGEPSQAVKDLLKSRSDAMSTTPDDWRLMGQEVFLQEAVLTWEPYHAHSATWEHDHCPFCSAKFMDPQFSDAHRQHIADDPAVLTQGYTTTAEHEHGRASHWVCETCFNDFRDRFEWRLVGGSDR
jgi:hypothetical protein